MTTEERNEIQVEDKQTVVESDSEPTFAGRFFTPQVDIYSTDEEITMVADVPGVQREGLDIDLRDGVLTVVGKVSQVSDELRLLQREYEVGGYLRRFNIHEDIDGDAIEAKLKDGVLTVSLPLAEAARPRKIEVQLHS